MNSSRLSGYAEHFRDLHEIHALNMPEYEHFSLSPRKSLQHGNQIHGGLTALFGRVKSVVGPTFVQLS